MDIKANLTRKPFDIYHRKNTSTKTCDSDIENSNSSQHLTFIEGHRGIDYVPENTLKAYQAAMDAQCDCIELDVRKFKIFLNFLFFFQLILSNIE